MLFSLNQLPKGERKFAQEMINWGILPTIVNGEDTFFTRSQYSRIKKIIESECGGGSAATIKHTGFQLFPSEHELYLSNQTGIARAAVAQKNIIGSKVLLQLLPNILEEAENLDSGPLGYVDIPGSDINIVSRNFDIIKKLQQQQVEFRKNAENRTAFFSRSASYMGSKATLAAALIEIVDNFFEKDVIVFDLMCGSGASSSAFSRSRKVYASDAQLFSQHLAVVQGGGMTEIRAKEIVSSVTKTSLTYYLELPSTVHDDIDLEEYYLTTELSADDKSNFIEWVKNYARVGDSGSHIDSKFLAELERHREALDTLPGILYVRYYANLFFGVRQAAEIDCLRKAIDTISDPNDRAWALGTLICAVSACADNYGGHFAQPKFDISQPARVLVSLKDTLLKRSLSVTHEFSARLLNLARESEAIDNSIDVIPGPWKKAIDIMSEIHSAEKIMVYLDPPYTRDEYSRYYHVLETLVRYDYPKVSGKSSAPAKGNGGRFASEFFTRNSLSAEKLISEIIISCLDRNWDCTWSYSNSGLANIVNVIKKCEKYCENIEFFQAQYSYKAQGKQRAKDVEEYIIVFKYKRFS